LEEMDRAVNGGSGPSKNEAAEACAKNERDDTRIETLPNSMHIDKKE
jgi:hypothetical protein